MLSTVPMHECSSAAACGKALIFDLDGTLLHTAPDLADAVNAMLVELGRETLPEQTVANYVGKGAENLIHRSLTGSLTERADAALFHRAHDSFRAHYETTAQRIAARLTKGSESGAMRPGLGEVHAWAILGMNVFLGLRYGVWSDGEASAEVARQANELIAQGIAAHPED